MIKKNNAFTLIELLVVITIIIVISTSGIMYFFKFLDSIDIKKDINEVKNNINSLDLKVKKYEIFDYKVEFKSGSLGYVYYTNSFDIPYNQTITLDTTTGSGIIKTNTLNSGGVRLLKIYKEYKIYSKIVLDSNDIYTGSFDKLNNYKITGTLSGETLNDIYIRFFSGEGSVNLDVISEDPDKSNICNNVLSIKNIGGKKSILCGNTIWSKLYLFFSSNGVEEFIEIN